MKQQPFDDRITLLVPSKLKREARIKALREGTNLSRLVRRWLAEYIIAPPKGEDNDGTETDL